MKKDSELEVLEQEVVRMKEEEEAKVVKLKEEQEVRLHQTLDRLRQKALLQDIHMLSVYTRMFLVSGLCDSFRNRFLLMKYSADLVTFYEDDIFPFIL